MPALKYDKDFHPVDLLERMGRGELDVRIQAAWGIEKSTFIEWKKTYPEFKEAYQKGLPACESKWWDKVIEKAEKGEDKGFKAIKFVMAHKFGYADESKSSITNVQINNTQNMLDNQSSAEILQNVKNKLEKFTSLGMLLPPPQIIDVEIIEKTDE